MPRRLRQQIHDFLKDYRKSVFELVHDEEHVKVRVSQAECIANEVLDQKFHYHFHKKVDTDRAETIQLIHNYCREALLPPVVTRFTERLLLLEQRHQLTLEYVEKVLETFAAEMDHENPETVDPLPEKGE